MRDKVPPILKTILIKIQLHATVHILIYLLQSSSTCFWCLPHPFSGVLKTVTAASGTGHNIGTPTSFHRGLS